MASEDLPANGHGGPADPSAKGDRRRTLRAARRAFVAGLPAEERERLEIALAAVLDRHLPSGVVAGYEAIGGEIGVGHLTRVTLFPHAVAGAPLAFADAAGRTATPAVVLVPLIAIDPRGVRLGQGGGHYDRTLAGLRAAGRVLAVGVAWEMQRVGWLPADPWDEPLDALATPAGWFDITRATGC